MTCVDNSRGSLSYFHFTGGDNGVFVSNSVGVRNSMVKVRSSKSVAKMGNDSGCRVSGSDDSRVGLTFLAAPESISISVAIVSSIVSTIVWAAITIITTIPCSRIGLGIRACLHLLVSKSQTGQEKKRKNKFHDACIDRESE